LILTTTKVVLWQIKGSFFLFTYTEALKLHFWNCSCLLDLEHFGRCFYTFY